MVKGTDSNNEVSMTKLRESWLSDKMKFWFYNLYLVRRGRG